MSVTLFANIEDLDKLREMEMFGENGRDGVWTVMVNVMDPVSLHEAFDGCVGVFHTSSLVDPGGISGYTVSYLTWIDFHIVSTRFLTEYLVFISLKSYVKK